MKKYTKIIADESDVVFGFDYKRLNNIPDSFCIGHVGLILKLEGDNLLYLDPGPRNYGVRKVNIDDLYIAINKSDGLLIIINRRQDHGKIRKHTPGRDTTRRISNPIEDYFL